MNVSSVKNLNGEVFSAVQDASLTNVVQTNSGNWQDITAYQNNSASYQPSGNYIPYTGYNDVGGYATNKPLTVEGDLLGMKTKVAGAAIFLNSDDAFGLNTNTTLTPYHLNFSGEANGSAQVDLSSINKWNDVSTTVQSNSAQWAEEVISSYTTATIEGTNAINSLNRKPIMSFRTQSAQEAGVADKARYDYNGNNLADDHNSLTALNNVVQTNSAQWAEQPNYEYDDTNKISAINGSAIAGGGEVPEDVMVESAIGYNAVNEISGYNGSAIAQYGAEKQWLVHDDTLVHAANSAQYALGCNISALQRLMGIDETVLYSANTGVTAFTASEPLTNFKEVVFYVAPNPNDTTVSKITLPMTGHNTETIALTYHSTWNGFKGGIQISTEYTNTGMSAFQLISGAWFGWAGNTVNTGTYYEACIYKIIGIGRKQ